VSDSRGRVVGRLTRTRGVRAGHGTYIKPVNQRALSQRASEFFGGLVGWGLLLAAEKTSAACLKGFLMKRGEGVS
jgi:hypothetical protein